MITRKNSRCGTAPRISVQGWLTHTRRHWEYQLLMAHNSLSMETAVSNFPCGQQRSPHTPAFLSTFQMFLQRIFPNRPFIHSLLLWLSVAKSCLTVCDPIDCGTPGSPILLYFPEFAQTHVHRVSSLEIPNSLASLMPRMSKFLWPLAGRIAGSPSRKPSMSLGTGSAKGVGCRECGTCYDAWKHFFKKMN